jgi:hypothetical protein
MPASTQNAEYKDIKKAQYISFHFDTSFYESCFTVTCRESPQKSSGDGSAQLVYTHGLMPMALKIDNIAISAASPTSMKDSLFLSPPLMGGVRGG